ncbi:MAG: ATP-dependent Clp protease ATP-binding subunit [Patescibacteria group bacterium]
MPELDSTPSQAAKIPVARKIFFRDPRLLMTLPGRFTVRVAGYVGHLVLSFAALTFIISDIASIRLCGLLLILFLGDRLIHFREADLPLTELPRDGNINLARYLRPKAFVVLETGLDKSFITGRDFLLEIIHESIGLPEISEALRRLDVSSDEFKQKTEEFLESSKEKTAISKEDRLALTESLVREAFAHALTEGHRFIEPSDLFSAMSTINDDFVKRLFGIFEISGGDLDKALIFASARAASVGGILPASVGGFSLGSHRLIRHRIMNRAWTSRPTPTLDRYSLDFTDIARTGQIGFLIGHKEEYERLVTTLARPINPNTLLVGESGIGKEAIVRHLAMKLIKDDVPPALFDKRLVTLEISSLVAGAPPEELNLRLKNIIEEILIAGNIILYIPDIHNIVKTSGTAFISAADALMPVIMNNDFPVIGATYPKEFKEFIESRSDFVGAFEVIYVSEITESDAEKLLSYESIILERQFKTTISFGAIKKAVSLARKFFHNKFLPSSAEEILKSALIDTQKAGKKMVGPAEVISAAEAKIDIPMHEAGAVESKRLLNLEDIIHERIVGQEEAVKAVSEAIREYRSGLSRKGGPIASFLFVGPTGVGKTELAKTLAKIQFGSEKLMVRFDMTEYQDKQSFFRFIGSPDGHVSGALTDAIIQKPYSLILLDEFEKAYPDILNLFLQVLDDGRLTDNLGRTVDFANTIIIATSNAHSDIINEALNKGETMSDISEYLRRKLTDVFKPELLNRFSKIVIFKNLLPKDLEKVVALYLNELAAGLVEQGITLEFDASVITQFARLGYDPAFGARPLRRVIDEKLRSPLSKKILEKGLPRGSIARVVMNGDEVEFVTN